MKARNAHKIIPVFVFVYLALTPNLSADGHFELGFHYGTWNLNLLGDTVENGLSEALESVFKDDVVSYAWLGELDVAGGPTETYEDSGTKTIEEIKEELEEEEDFPLSFLPFIQLNLGLKGKITQNIHLMADVGIWNGFIIRGGIALRL